MSFSKGEILLVELVFSSQAGRKARPVMVVYDSGDDDLLVIPVTSHTSRTRYDIPISEWRHAGLRMPSLARTEKLATIAKSTVIRKLGKIGVHDLVSIRSALDRLFQSVLLELA